MNKKLTFGKLLIFAVLIVYTLFLFFPIITILITSFVPSEELATSTDFIWWSENANLEAYKTIFVYDSAERYLRLKGVE